MIMLNFRYHGGNMDDAFNSKRANETTITTGIVVYIIYVFISNIFTALDNRSASNQNQAVVL